MDKGSGVREQRREGGWDHYIWSFSILPNFIKSVLISTDFSDCIQFRTSSSQIISVLVFSVHSKLCPQRAETGQGCQVSRVLCSSYFRTSASTWHLAVNTDRQSPYIISGRWQVFTLSAVCLCGTGKFRAKPRGTAVRMQFVAFAVLKIFRVRLLWGEKKACLRGHHMRLGL